jgi:hypothetical protein
VSLAFPGFATTIRYQCNLFLSVRIVSAKIQDRLTAFCREAE